MTPDAVDDGVESVDAALDRLEGTAARLADPGASIDELAAAYEEGLRLLAAVEARLAALKGDFTPQ